ncbi:MAG: hypothetical protein EBR02_09380 [Alphaproteobacteria bacterium]|nr:hypothetical protein [Alphaproteobacteria bacterium]
MAARKKASRLHANNQPLKVEVPPDTFFACDWPEKKFFFGKSFGRLCLFAFSMYMGQPLLPKLEQIPFFIAGIAP